MYKSLSPVLKPIAAVCIVYTLTHGLSCRGRSLAARRCSDPTKTPPLRRHFSHSHFIFVLRMLDYDV